MHRIFLIILGLLGIRIVFADTPLAAPKLSESQAVTPKLTESQVAEILAEYGGVIGTAPKGQTISNAGGGIEFWPNAFQFYGLFAQTLSSGIYYEARLYGRSNYIAPNPAINVPASNINNPFGYGAAFMLGYNFHAGKYLEITPYLRFDLFNDMVVVYEDSDGDSINSMTYAYIIGSKFTTAITSRFSAYVDLSAGYFINDLTGQFPGVSGGATSQITGGLTQTAISYEIGVPIKLNNHLAFAPYWRFITIFNDPNSIASTPIDQGGFGITQQTATLQVFGLKFNAFW